MATMTNRLLIVALLLTTSAVSFVAGVLTGGRDACHRQFLSERRVLAPVLDDPAFAGVQVDEFSTGGCSLIGAVATERDKDRLQAGVVGRWASRRWTG